MEPWTDDELCVLATDLESPLAERKRKVTRDEKQKIQRTLCAFANDILGLQRPGVLFIGIDDDGTPSGLSVDDKVLQDLGNFVLSGALTPRPAHHTRPLTLPGGQRCAVLTIDPHPLPPVRFNGDVFVRRGPQTTKATVEDERRLAERNRAGQLPFMLREAWEATSDDLDDVLVARYVERVVGQETRALNHRPLAHQLRALKLVGSTGRPTHLGLLLAGCDPHAILETSYLQFIRHRGTDRTSPIDDQQRLDGPLLTLLERALEVLEAWNGHPIETSAARHVIHPIYPARALREALVNAVVHRDYELPSPIYVRWFADRIEITSPGGLHPPVTGASLTADGSETAYRNERLAEAMVRLGYAQRFGLGVVQIHAAMAENGNPPPRFEVGEHHVQVTLPARPV